MWGVEGIEDVESDVAGDGAEQQDECLRAGHAKNPLNWIGATRHELCQWAVSKATDDIVLVDIVEKGEDDPVRATVKEAYLNHQKMLMAHFKVASDKNKVEIPLLPKI
jgi:hypothetical protein